MRFEFATAARIVFGPGVISELPALAREFGTRALVVTGSNPSRAEHLVAGLKAQSIDAQTFAIPAEPTVDMVRKGTLAARGRHFVIGFGGGSAIDAAKAIAALAPNSGEPLDYLEVIGRGKPLEHAPLPFLAVATTAGTGAEVTRNAVLGSPEDGVKASLRSPLMLAKIALVDPELTVELPPDITASTGLDTLTQLIEPYVSVRANPMTDVFCLEGLQKAPRALAEAFADGKNRRARESMSWSSLLSGLALANAGLGVVHGFAAPLGGMLDAPHGVLCASVLPHGMAGNIQALRERAPGDRALSRYADIARLLTGNAAAFPEHGAEWVARFCGQLRIPRLRQFGLTPEQIPELVDKVSKASSTKANPITLTPAELTTIAERAL